MTVLLIFVALDGGAWVVVKMGDGFRVWERESLAAEGPSESLGLDIGVA